MPHCDDVLPVRSWDELMTAVELRATTLRRRRRRRVAWSLATALVAAVLVSGSVQVLLQGRDVDALVTDTATRPTPEPTAAPVLVAETAPPAVLSSRGPSVEGSRPARAVLAAAAGLEPRGSLAPAPVLRPPSTLAPRPMTPAFVRFTDAVGDADTDDGNKGQAAVSDSSRDIVQMRFDREHDGIRVSMDLASASALDGNYRAFFTDSGSGCRLVVHLGVPGMTEDGFYAYCGQQRSDYIYVPPTKDPSMQRLQAFLPYSLTPPGVDLRRKLGNFGGETWVQHLNQDEIRVDRASTTQVLDGAR